MQKQLECFVRLDHIKFAHEVSLGSLIYRVETKVSHRTNLGWCNTWSGKRFVCLSTMFHVKHLRLALTGSLS